MKTLCSLLKSNFVSILCFIILCAGVGFANYVFKTTDAPLKDTTSKWDLLWEKGDFVGGISSPFIELVALILATSAFVLQRRELAEQGESFRQQVNLQKDSQNQSTFNLLYSNLEASLKAVQVDVAIIQRQQTVETNYFGSAAIDQHIKCFGPNRS